MDKDTILNLVKIKYQLENTLQELEKYKNRTLLSLASLDQILELYGIEEMQQVNRLKEQKKKGII